LKKKTVHKCVFLDKNAPGPFDNCWTEWTIENWDKMDIKIKTVKMIKIKMKKVKRNSN